MAHSKDLNSGQKRATLRKALNRTRRIADEQAEAASLGITPVQLGVRKWRQWKVIYAAWLHEQRSHPVASHRYGYSSHY